MLPKFPQKKRKCFVSARANSRDKEFVQATVCKQLEVKFENNNNFYCVLHLPDKNKHKNTNFIEVFRGRIQAQIYDFRFVYFPAEVNLTDHTFKNGVDFSESVFSQKVSFSHSIFKNQTYFSLAVFNQDVDFSACIFDETSEIFFYHTNFKKKLDLRACTFKGYVFFESDKRQTLLISENSNLELQNARLEYPKRIFFHSVTLRPSWFINVDSREFTFTNIHWKNVNNDFIKTNVESELKELEKRQIQESKILLKIACRQLAENAENNNRFEEASNFRRMAFECERLERNEKISKWWSEPINCSSIFGKLKEKAKSFPFDLFHWLYRWTSGYGENRLWAFFVLFLILSISAILYTTPLCEFPSGQNEVRSLGFIEAISYSLRVMVLQRPEPFPINDFGKIVLAFETVLAPLQLALLALAIRRKFMR